MGLLEVTPWHLVSIGCGLLSHPALRTNEIRPQIGTKGVKTARNERPEGAAMTERQISSSWV